MNNLEKEMIRQRHSRSHHHSQSHFLRNFPNINMAHMAKSVIKPITTTIHHVSPLLTWWAWWKGYFCSFWNSR